MVTTTWSISEIKAWNYYVVINTNGTTIPYGLHVIWNSTNHNEDGKTGSFQPNIFRNLFTEKTATEIIQIKGSASFPSDWRGNSYQLVGVLNRRTVFGSQLVKVPSSGNDVTVNRLSLYEPYFATRKVEIPFRYGGDFTWYLRLYKDKKPTNIWLTSTANTRLELCWARATFPQGPLEAKTKEERTRVDMSPGYPILLWRLFAPPPTELPDTMPEDVPFYIRRSIVSVIWNPCSTKPRYDTTSGAARYALSHLGNGFKLGDWYKATYELCNCYDIAGISQLACSLMMDNSGKELADSHWVFQEPNGYINRGPLIGWVRYGGDHLRCNTPFWNKNGTAAYVEPNDARRTWFGKHAWVEVTHGGATGVLDACHSLRGIPPIPSVGDSTRQAYLQKTLDQTKTHGNANAKVGTSGTGSCWINPDTSLIRIGVFNPWGKYIDKKPTASSATASSVTASLMTTSPTLDTEIEALIERSKTPGAAPPTHNTADLAGLALSQVLGLTPVRDSSTSVFPSAARITVSFERDADTRIVVTIDAFKDFEQPVHALVDFLSGFQARPLDSVIQPGPPHPGIPHLGAYSFHTRTGAFWLRGNLLIRIDQFADHVEQPPFDPALAARLDEHLTAGQAVPHLPSLGIPSDAIPSIVPSGETIRVALGIDLNRLAAVTSVSEDSEVVLPGGPPDTEGGYLVFYAHKPGTTRVAIVGAVKGSLRPIDESFEITVEGPEAPTIPDFDDAPDDLPVPPPSLGDWPPVTVSYE